MQHEDHDGSNQNDPRRRRHRGDRRASLNAHVQCTICMNLPQQTMDGHGACGARCGTISSAKDQSLLGTLGMSPWRVQIVNDERRNRND